ncbi:hypothetical protein [Nannocystis bainbridge]|uniref:Uncharacterized protein n=1 Tax=Nannocystis bainbridge TaxID=2995303 RepID=A0ABT5DSI4_9BACT|nr:hypothetical protein [Nannocystis bainbridge]MDC0716511.1 hypothetical protein [Nannocystis bainbridge]
MQPDLLDLVSAPTLINTVVAGDALSPLLRQAVVLPVLAGFVLLFLVALRGRFVGRSRWIDRVAVVTLLLLALLTKPDRAQHATALRAADLLNAPVLIHGDYLVVSATTGHSTLAIGVFGKVFVFHRDRSPPRKKAGDRCIT